MPIELHDWSRYRYNVHVIDNLRAKLNVTNRLPLLQTVAYDARIEIVYKLLPSSKQVSVTLGYVCNGLYLSVTVYHVGITAHKVGPKTQMGKNQN